MLGQLVFRRWAVLFFSVLLVLILAGCNSESLSSEIILLGGIAPLDSTAGPQMVNSAALAIKDINDAGGVMIDGRRYHLDIVWEDDGGNPEQAVVAAQRLINQNHVVAIIGPPYSRPAIAAAGVAESAGIPLVSPTATNPDVTAGYSYIFRATFVDDVQGYAMARFALTELGYRQTAVLYDISNAYNRGLAETFRDAFIALGGEIVAFESYTAGADDFSPMLTRIAQSGAEALFLPNYTDDVIKQGEQLHEMGLEILLLGSDSWEGDLISPYPAFEGSFFSGHFCRSMDDPDVADFSARYYDAYKQEVNGLIALTYDSVQIIFAAIVAQGKFNSQAIRDGLYNVPYEGLTGRIEFGTTGDPTKPVTIWRLVGGERDCYQLFEP